MVQDICIVSIKVEYEVVCALSNGDIAGDLGWRYGIKLNDSIRNMVAVTIFRY